MLETLDDVPWATLSHAYGPAVDVPDWVRNIAHSDDKHARESIGHLAAAVFHQGTWDETTAKVVPFLVELIAQPVPCADSVALLLADMSAGHDSDGYYGSDPFVFTSDPGPPTYDEAVAVLVAIEEGRGVFIRQLTGQSPQLRASLAYLLGGMKPHPDTCAALQSALDNETEDSVQASLALAIGKLGQAPECESQHPLVQGCVAVARAWVAGKGSDPQRSPALIKLLTHPYEDTLHWVGGHANRLSVRVLLVHAHTNVEVQPEVIHVLRVALRLRLRRGEGVLNHSFSSRPERPPPSATVLPTYASPLTALSTALGVLLFPERQDPLLPEELSEEQREALSWVIKDGLAVPTAGIPFREAEHLQRYLSGKGILATLLEVGGQSAPIWCWLHCVVDEGIAKEHQADVFDALLSLEAPALLDVALAIQNGTYPHPRGGNTCLPPKLFTPIRDALQERASLLLPVVEKRARTLAAASDFPSAGSSTLLIAIAQYGSWPPNNEWLPLLKRAVYRDEGYAMFLTLTPFQQLHCVASVGNYFTFSRLVEHVDVEKVAPLFVHNVIQSGWRFDEENTERVLNLLGDAVIEPLQHAELQASGDKRKFIRRVLDSRRCVPISLDLIVIPLENALEFVIKTEESVHSYRLETPPKRTDYKPIGELLMRLNASHVHVVIEERPAPAIQGHEHLGYQITQGISGHVKNMTLHLPTSSLSIG